MSKELDLSIVKEIAVERFQERIDKTIITFVNGLDYNDAERMLISHLDDYYNNVATHEEREEFLREHEELPF